MTASRTPRGRFAPGHSGNYRGRPPKQPEYPAIKRQGWTLALYLANETLLVAVPGGTRRVRMRRFEAACLALMTSRGSARRSIMAFIDLVWMAARTEEVIRYAPRRWPISPSDYTELKAAALAGSYDDWEIAMKRLIERVPGIEEMTDTELVEAMDSARKGLGGAWPQVVEERLAGLVEILNDNIKGD